MNLEILEDIGFTRGEAIVYLTLLELGPSKVGSIIEKSNLQSSVVHNCLNKLIEKGFVSFIKEGEIKHYNIIDPNLILDYIEDKKRKYQEILPELLAKQKLAKEKLDAELFIGIKGLKSMFKIAFANCGQIKEYLFFAHLEQTREILDFYKEVNIPIIHKKIKIRGLANIKFRKQLLEEYKGQEPIKLKFLEIPFPSPSTIINDYLLIINWIEKPIGIMIKSKTLVNNYRNFFEQMWKIAKN
ncbi:MAG: helix-turn-helix domain-containing protein [Candidatus Woesearchaeota archaeon]